MDKILILAVFVLIFTNNMCVANSTQHPLDSALEECLKNKISTFEMNACVIKAQKLWLKELKNELEGIRKKLSDEQLIKFNITQDKWFEYYKAEKKLISNTLFTKNGDINSSFGNNYLLEILKQRALFLKQYSYTLTY